jgi:secreted protein with Ig-like and vWFA domain/anti-sigma factor RsiW
MKPENITAWALNELSTEEKNRLVRELETDPENQVTAAATQKFCTLLTRELRDESLALTPEQRARLIQPQASSVLSSRSCFQPKPLRWWQRPAIPMAAAAALIILGTMTAFYVNDAQETPVQVAQVSPEHYKIQQQKRVTVNPSKAVAAAPATGLKRPMASSQVASLNAGDAPADLLKGVASPMALPGSPPPLYSPVAVGAVNPSVAHVQSRQRRILSETESSESYGKIVENTLTSVAREPLSTFSIDVDTASYANVRRFLNLNAKPPRDEVRIEELLNYFPSSDPAPTAKDKQPFAVKAEMAACPWQPQHKLVRLHLKGREVPTGDKPSNLVFLVDVSGSMQGPEKLELVQRSLRLLTERLGENDRVSLVTYAGGTEVVLPPTNGLQKASIITAIDRLQPGGSTAGSAGIKLAYEQAVSGFIQGGGNRVLLCTDGDFNVGISAPQELEKFIAEKARTGVFLSVLGFGTGNLKDHTMETLADKGNGNYAYIDSLSEAHKVLVEQMQGTLVTIAKDMKIQVEFNPAVVREYRLIGYENRLLAKEDFNDDTKDSGEIGAGHSVTALYELVPANLQPGQVPIPAVDPLKYQPQVLASPPAVSTTKPEAATEVLTVKLRYKEPEGTTSKLIEIALNDDARSIGQASAEFKFSAAVAGFGMLLRESTQAAGLTWERVRQLAREGKGSDPLGYRGEFLQLIEKAAGGKP